MKERPILMSAPMVRALLDGSKTQTRRIVKKNASGRASKGGRNWHLGDPDVVLACPHGQPGDRIYVKETWAYHVHALSAKRDEDGPLVYRADGDGALQQRLCDRWRPSIFMPRWASRILLEITDVRVERLQDISEEDAKAEGIDGYGDCYCLPYRRLWESINGAGSWDTNPWVWVVEFRRIGHVVV